MFLEGQSHHVISNKDLIFVCDLEFSDDIINQISNLKLDTIPWVIGGYRRKSNDSFFNGKIKIFSCYEDEKWSFDFTEKIFHQCLEVFKKLDPDIKLNNIIRCNLNYASGNGSMVDADIHHDSYVVTNWSFLVYLTGKDGNTDFFDSSIYKNMICSVDYKPAKVIIFPSIYPHQGHIPSDCEPRLTLNYMVDVETNLENKILSKSSQSIQNLFKRSK